jgi:biopolymer transport protein ExbB/TolQ
MPHMSHAPPTAAIESDVIFEVAEALRIPVLVLTLAALAAVLFELGGFAVELLRRRRRDFIRLKSVTDEAHTALVERGDHAGAREALAQVAWSAAMGRALSFFVGQWGRPDAEAMIAKSLADYDFGVLRRLERTRLLVRAGPALGLMGTLIPLSPALAGLAAGDVQELSENLRVAFSVTVLGLLIGAVAFALSLVRDRLYGQDLSDLEFVASRLTAPVPAAPAVVSQLAKASAS